VITAPFRNFLPEEPPSSIAFRDVIFGALGIFVVFFILFITHINPPAKKDDGDITSPGNVIIKVEWPGKLDIDIDTWVWLEGEPRPVGYSYSHGVHVDLLRDDLGLTYDETNEKFELMIVRGTIPGRYIINIHCFSIKEYSSKIASEGIPIKVLVERFDGNSSHTIIYSNSVVLKEVKEEKTVVVFELDENGTVVRNSKATNKFIPLAGRKTINPQFLLKEW